MSALAHDRNDLGPRTEALIAAAFGESVTITAKAAATLLGMTVSALREMTDGGLIRAVRRGKVRAYTEADIRAYLAEGPDLCREARKRENARRPDKVVPFSARNGARGRERLQARPE